MSARRGIGSIFAFAALSLTVVASTGCEPMTTLTVTSAPPPGGVAELDSNVRVLTLSRGSAVVLAFGDGHTSLEGFAVTVDDREVAIASVVPQEQRFIVAGLQVGDTDLHLTWDDGGSYDVAVDVVAE